MENKNIILIGMPGSGKTTIGRILSNKLHMQFIDMDDAIKKMTYKSIEELFEQGEEHFRDAESAVCIMLSSNIACVIACGGGIVKRKDNINILKKSGSIFFIDRPIEKIASDIDINTRPLIKDGIENLYRLYEKRINLYKDAADFVVLNDTTATDAADDIINLLK